jgi:hypothetical protein
MKDAPDTMARVINRSGDHGTGDLEKDKAGAGIDVSLRGPFKRDKQRSNLENAQHKKV